MTGTAATTALRPGNSRVPIASLVNLSPDREAARWRAADQARISYDVTLPRLAHWNYDPCEEHQAAGLTRGCQNCGAMFRRHQRTGIAYFYLAMKGLLGDGTGTGKTLIITGLLAMLKEAGELGMDYPARRAVIVCRPAAVLQWRDEINRLTTGISVITATGTPQQRSHKYTSPWEVLVIGADTLRLRQIRKTSGTTTAGDLEAVELFDPGIVIYDDTDAMRNPDNKTYYAVSRLCERAPRAIAVHATPLQKHLPELWSFLSPVGGREMFGPLALFKHRFVKMEINYYAAKDRYGRTVTKSAKKDAGIKNGAELRKMLAPLVLRRTASEIDDADSPVLQPSTVWLDPSPGQARRYAELRQGVLRKLREDGERVSRPDAMARFTHGAQICSGLATLDGSGGDDSVKLDWVVDRVDGDMSDEKVVCFVYFRPNVQALSDRLTALGIGHVLLWSEETSPRERHARLTRFREDPACRVLIGTPTIEQSLNLQVARHLVLVDTIINAARMQQLAGRVQRDGSPHSTVYCHQLLLRGTQEERYLDVLRMEAAVADYVWGGVNEMFESLAPAQLLRLITGDPVFSASVRSAS